MKMAKISPQNELQIKTNPDNARNFQKYSYCKYYQKCDAHIIRSSDIIITFTALTA